MIKKIVPYSLLIPAFLFVGCASTYKSIRPESMSYVKDNASSPEVIAEYHYNSFIEANNRKYHKKELKNYVQVVAIKITNKSDIDLEYNRNFQLYNGDSPLSIMQTEYVYNNLKQQAPLYLLHLLWCFTTVSTNTTTTSGNTVISSEQNTFPVGLIIGPVVALGNVLVASNANTKFRNQLQEYSIFNKVIRKGESKYFLIGLNNNTFQPISVKVGKSSL